MGKRLSKIYTRTGDDGTTGLGDGTRTPKDSPRVEAYGTVDEANSAIGVVLSHDSLPDSVRSSLTEVQHDLFELGGELCIPGHSAITAAMIDRRQPRGSRLSPGPYDRAPRRTTHEDARGSGIRAQRGAAVPEPALRPAVRLRAGAVADGRRLGSTPESRTRLERLPHQNSGARTEP